MKLIKKDKKGFTLVELIVVIAILAILALILIPAITGYVSKAEDSRNEANARALYSQASFELYTWDGAAPDNGALAAKLDAGEGDVSVVITNGELTSVTYTDPKGKTATWPKP